MKTLAEILWGNDENIELPDKPEDDVMLVDPCIVICCGTVCKTCSFPSFVGWACR